jgi:hypothetical protein
MGSQESRGIKQDNLLPCILGLPAQLFPLKSATLYIPIH